MRNHPSEDRADAAEPSGPPPPPSDRMEKSVGDEEADVTRMRNQRETRMSLEDQVETNRLVLQLVTDSRFNMTQINGQRKLGGPPPGWKGPPPGPGCEVFVGKIPRTLYEHEIYPIFRRMGEVYEIRLMMDFSGTNRGYCFVMFGKPEFAQKAIRELDNFEIRPGRRIGVVASINNCRLYVGQLPTDVASETVIRKIYDITDDVGQVSVYRNVEDQARYALISYKTHRGAAMARRRLVPERATLFGGAEVSIDWAHPGMYPSNVIEETGTVDEDGSIELSRSFVGNETKRYQNRRKARDEFLDHSIRAYLQSDRGAPRGRQSASHLKQAGCTIGAIRSYLNSAAGEANKIICGSLEFIPQQSLGQAYAEMAKISGKAPGTNSSFELNGGSSSSESSASSSQGTEGANSEFGMVGVAVNNLLNFDRLSIGEEKNRTVAAGGGNLFANVQEGYESLNLFENYTFGGNSHGNIDDQVNHSWDNNFADNCFDESNSQQEKIDGEIQFEVDNNFGAKNRKTGREGEQKSRVNRGKKNFAFEQSEGTVYAGSNLLDDNVQGPIEFGGEKFSRTIGTPLNNKRGDGFSNLLQKQFSEKNSGLTKSAAKAATITRSNLISNVCRQNDWQTIAVNNFNFANFAPPSGRENGRSMLTQNRNIGINSLVLDKNNKNSATGRCNNQRAQNFHQRGKMAALSQEHGYQINPNCMNLNNLNDGRDWISAQLAYNACDFNPDYFNANSCRLASSGNSLAAYLGQEFLPDQLQPVFVPSHNRQNNLRNLFHTGEKTLVNIAQAACCRIAPAQFQNKKTSNFENPPKAGRPILSRSHASLPQMH
ncbi:uncharacterized protein LOC107226705 isoform X1 [Neodiprion lecontei]|uniref:Uncharacterized protein LOC107226705 isoform X1 n=1 Tax=Neodiprion lecontei TaxID=441921 RepID=A0ABM3FDW4_NEOLC|nr:uncharacterized protein LOC107226705 isoform X1 [Neodiprion lecontei]XP_046586220.1 uncharacterized protein LOC107226705 isoform X1 [Neodiprion lecontei]